MARTVGKHPIPRGCVFPNVVSVKARVISSRRAAVMRRLAGAVGAGALVTGALLTDVEPLPVTYADPGPKTDGDDCAAGAAATPDCVG
jgi:hypothetical protein